MATFLSLVSPSQAQDSGGRSENEDQSASPSFFGLSGTLTVTSDLYSFSTNPDSAQLGRRPASLHRLIFTPVLRIGDAISLPFNFILTSPETNTNTPRAAHPTFAQYFQNPANSLGFSSFSPKIGWVQLNAGSFTPALTSLTAGDQQLFGAGFDLTPGSFRLVASAGISQRAIQQDASIGASARYRRDMYAGRLAIGDPDSSSFGINLVYAKDALGSLANNVISITAARPAFDDPSVIIPPDTVHLHAEEGVVASADFGFMIADGVGFKAEAATSIFTRDQESAEKSFEGNPLAGILVTRTTTNADLAGTAAFSVKRSTWGITLSGLYMGAGYVPIGYTFLQSDRLEWKVSPELRFFDRQLTMRGSLGQRVNNLSKTKGETSTMLIGSGYLNAEISEAFSIGASYSNFGLRNDQRSDTLKVQNVSQSISIDPTLTIIGESITQMFSVSAGLDTYDDFNTVSGALNANKTRSLIANYSINFPENPFTLGLSGSYLENELVPGTLIIRNLGIAAGYSLFDRKLVPTISLTFGGSTDGKGATDRQLFLKGGFRWEIITDVSLSAIAGVNNSKYGNSTTRGTDFKEQLLQLALSTPF